jgi:hypothetical protein
MKALLATDPNSEPRLNFDDVLMPASILQQLHRDSADPSR